MGNVTADEKRDYRGTDRGEWYDRVEAAFSDPNSVEFIATSGRIFILGGAHAYGHAFCWCQPHMRDHGAHKDAIHREQMD